MPACAVDCPNPNGGGGEGGAPQGLIAGSAENGQADNTQVSDDSSDAPAGDEVEDPAMAARWATFMAWFNANPPENHPGYSDEEYDAEVMDRMNWVVAGE